ncbi:MAG: lasso peptide biosynthesis B2 protein [Ignavibacteriales bacterium]|nr:lasso peptide biosynthesis B2 protein [Ignavibacteriales bacterium]
MKGRRVPFYRRIASVSAQDFLLFIEAIRYALAARARLKFIPFKKLAATLGEHMKETPREPYPDQALLDRVALATRRSGRYVKIGSRCFVEAITAKKMLAKRGAPSVIYLGVRKENGELLAHAWLRCGDRIVVGDGGLERFAVVSTFA